MTVLVMAGILIFGLAGYRLLPVSTLPNVDFPTIQVTGELPGASPETMASAVATPLAGSFEAGTQVARWDGSKRVGRARDGAYVVSVESTDAVGTARVELPVLLDRTAPRVRLVSASPAVLRVSEPATLVARVNGALRRISVAVAGDVRLRRISALRTLVVVARDAAGNRSVLRRR